MSNTVFVVCFLFVCRSVCLLIAWFVGYLPNRIKTKSHQNKQFVIYRIIILSEPIQEAEGFKARVCGQLLAEIAVSNPAGGMDDCCECSVLSGRGLCDGPIPRHGSLTDCGVSVCVI